MVDEFPEVSGGVVPENASYRLFIFVGAPEVADVGGVAALHVVELGVEVLLLGDEPLVHLQGAGVVLAVATDLVDLGQVVFKLLLRPLVQLLRVLDVLPNFLDFPWNSGDGWQFKPLTHEGITYPCDLVSHLPSLLEDNDVDSLFLFDPLAFDSLSGQFKFPEIAQSLPSGRSEEKFLKAVLLLDFDGPRNVSDGNVMPIID